MSHHSKQPRRSKAEGLQLIKAYQKSPSEETKTRIVKRYEALVRSLARRFSRRKEHEEDLIQVGMVGLLAALERYDPAFERGFESFAVPTIVGEIKRYLRDKTWSVHVPRRVKELGPRLTRTIEDLSAALQRSPTVEEIAERLDVSEEEVLETMEMSKSYQALSVDRTIDMDHEGGSVSLLDTLGEKEEGFRQVNQRLTLEKLLTVLSEREKKIIQLTYLKGLSQKEAGQQLQISQMHVSRLQRRALQKIRESMKMETSELMK